jgi:N utilization substance protein B
MGSRRAARECALMILYGIDASGQTAGSGLASFFKELVNGTGLVTDEDGRLYAEQLVLGVMENLTRVDEVVRTASANWRLERMTRVDRNLLRLAAWELLQGVPRAVAIDEAVELAKRFGTDESGKFVNGVLAKIADVVRAP